MLIKIYIRISKVLIKFEICYHYKFISLSYDLYKLYMIKHQQISLLDIIGSVFNENTSQELEIPSENELIYQSQLFCELQAKNSINVILGIKKTNLILRDETQNVWTLELDDKVQIQILYLDQENIKSKITGFKLRSLKSSASLSFFGCIDHIEAWINLLVQKISVNGLHRYYKPLQKLGHGSFASVYRTKDLRDEKHYALKAFSKKNFLTNQDLKINLKNQIQILRRLNSPGTLKLYAVYETENSLYLITELLKGKRLNDRIMEINGQQKIKMTIFKLLKALKHLVDNKIVHRDIKMENIMLKNITTLQPVLIDFGLAGIIDSTQENLDKKCGTPGYLAPQIFTETIKLSGKRDIFSLGVIMYILMTKNFLFKGSTQQEVFQKNKDGLITLNNPKLQLFSNSALKLLKLMLDKDPNTRISCQEALKHEFFDGIIKEELSPLETIQSYSFII